MVELNDFLDRICEREKLRGVGVLTSTWGKFEFNSSGSFSHDRKDLSKDTKFPLNHLFDIFTSIYFTYLLDDSYIDLRDPVINILKTLNIKEDVSSLVYLQPNHLLSHSSGLAKWRNSRDILRGRESQFSTSKEGMLRLRQYFNQPIVQLEKPGNIFVHNPMDYALIALMIEDIKNREFSELMTEFLQQYVNNVYPFDFDFEPGFIDENGCKKVAKKFFHLYPSTMASLSFKQFAQLFHILAFENIDQDYISYYLFDAHVKTEHDLDKIGYPLRFREDLGVYQLQSHGHGYSASLLVNVSERFFSLVVINKETKSSYRTLAEMQRFILRQHQQSLSLSCEGLDKSPTKSQVEVICDDYKIFSQQTLLNSLLFDELGGTFSIDNDHGRFVMRGRNFGILKSISRYAKKFDLKIINQSGDKLILGYNDGLYYSKIVIPNASKGGILYLELDQGPVLLRIDHSNDLLFRDRIWYRSIVTTFGYILFFKIFPVVRSTLTNFVTVIQDLRGSRKSFEQIRTKESIEYIDRSEITGLDKGTSTKTEQSGLSFVYRINDKIIDLIAWIIDHIYRFITGTYTLLKPFWAHFKSQISKLLGSIKKLCVFVWNKLIHSYGQLIVHINGFKQGIDRSNSLYPPKLTANRSGFNNFIKFSKNSISSYLSTTRFYPYLVKFQEDSNKFMKRIKRSISTT